VYKNNLTVGTGILKARVRVCGGGGGDSGGGGGGGGAQGPTPLPGGRFRRGIAARGNDEPVSAGTMKIAWRNSAQAGPARQGVYTQAPTLC